MYTIKCKNQKCGRTFEHPHKRAPDYCPECTKDRKRAYQRKYAKDHRDERVEIQRKIRLIMQRAEKATPAPLPVEPPRPAPESAVRRYRPPKGPCTAASFGDLYREPEGFNIDMGELRKPIEKRGNVLVMAGGARP